MKPFYYVCTFNLNAPEIKRYLEKTLLLVDYNQTVEFSLRSRLINSYTDAMVSVEIDFANKFGLLFDQEGNYQIQLLTIVNPKFAVSPDVAQAAADQFGQHDGHWDDGCVAATFFLNEENPDRSQWLMKYEVYFDENGIEVAKNGELDRLMLAAEADKFSCTYH